MGADFKRAPNLRSAEADPTRTLRWLRIISVAGLPLDHRLKRLPAFELLGGDADFAAGFLVMLDSAEPAADFAGEVDVVVDHQAGDHLAILAAADVKFFTGVNL